MIVKIINQFLGALDQIILWAFQVVIGVGTKLAIDSRSRNITKQYAFTSFIIASFVGYITDRLCTKWGLLDLRGVAVSVMALLSESIVRYLNDNSTAIMNAIFRRNLGIDMTKQGENIKKEEVSKLKTDLDETTSKI